MSVILLLDVSRSLHILYENFSVVLCLVVSCPVMIKKIISHNIVVIILEIIFLFSLHKKSSVSNVPLSSQSLSPSSLSSLFTPQVPSNPASQGLSHNSSTASSITRKSESKTHFTTREEARNKEREKDTGEREKERDNRGSNAGCLSSALLGPNSAQDVYSRNHQHQADSSAHADADADAGTTQRISGGGSSRGQDRNCSDRRGVTQRGRNNSATNRLRYLDSILDTLNSTNTDRDRDRAALSRSLPIALPQALIGDRLITQGGRDRGTNSHNRPSSSSTARRGTSTRSGINNLILMVDEVVSKLS